MYFEILIHACQETDSPIVAETMSLMLSKQTGQYVSERDALGTMEALKADGLLELCAPDEYVMRTAYVCMRPTTAGRAKAIEAAADVLSREAYVMWLKEPQ